MCLAGSGCREVCDSDEVRFGDKCATIPDAGTAVADASSETTTDVDGDATAEAATPDEAAVNQEDSSSSEAQCVDAAGAHGCVCSSDAEPNGATGCPRETPCEPNPCGHGMCTEGPEGYACVCDDGYAAGDTSAPCANIDECANSSLCTPDFPCRDLDPFYTCSGQMADWRMPGSSPSGVLAPASYTDNGDGTLRDEVTGLTWQKDDPGDTYAWEDAKRYCADLVLGGSAEWRLPSKIELESIINFTRTQPPAIDPTFTNTASEPYWTSTSAGPQSAYFVRFLFGQTDNWSLSSSAKLHARCVRDGVLRLSEARRYVTTTGTVADTRTGLVWERIPSSDSHDRISHHTRCESLSLEGELDWRLPSIKELLTIVDTTQGGRALDLNVFSGWNAGGYWTATPVSGGSAYWIVYLGPGSTDASESSKQFFSGCVR